MIELTKTRGVTGRCNVEYADYCKGYEGVSQGINTEIADWIDCEQTWWLNVPFVSPECDWTGTQAASHILSECINLVTHNDHVVTIMAIDIRYDGELLGKAIDHCNHYMYYGL